jgi:dihydroorotase
MTVCDCPLWKQRLLQGHREGSEGSQLTNPCSGNDDFHGVTRHDACPCLHFEIWIMKTSSMDSNFSRREFLQTAGGGGMLFASPTAGRLFATPAERRFDLIVAGGTVIDPYRKVQGVADVGIKGERIIEVSETLDPHAAARVVDARDLYVSPGWIDMHAHVFLERRRIAVHPDRDAGVHTGVTTVVDPGGFGSSDFKQFRSEIIEKSMTRILGFVNVSAYEGSPVHGDYTLFNQKLTINTLVENGVVLKGVKVLASERHCGNLGIVPVKLAVQAARESNTHVMAHIGMAPPLIQDVLNLLARGDIVTHCLKGFPAGMFHRDGRPVAEAWQAIRRGVRFDLGHGAGSFSWTAARHGRTAGLPLHSISTDLHRSNVNGPVWSYG